MDQPSLHTGSRRRPWKKIFAAVAVAAFVLLAGAIIFVLLFADLLLNQYAKEKIEKVFADAYPGYVLRIGSIHYSALKNYTECRGVTLLASDSSLHCSARSFSVSTIGWQQLISDRELTPDVIRRSVLSSSDIIIRLPHAGYEIGCGGIRISVPDSDITAEKLSMEFAQSRYRLRCGLLHAAAADSEISAEALELTPLAGDVDFFSASPYRRTRVSLNIRKTYLRQAPVLDLLQGKALVAGGLHVYDPSIELLVNRDKPSDPNARRPLMPAEALRALGSSIRLDSLLIRDARLSYGERLDPNGKPGVITFDSVRLSAAGIANAPRDTIAIQARGRFMNAGTMSVAMLIPMSTRAFSLSYRGSLTGMDVTALNRFLETAEHVRISSGRLHDAVFAVRVAQGSARGTVKVAYDDLYITMLDEKTGQKNVLGKQLTTLFANLIKIRGSNIPDDDGSMKIGSVSYVRKPGDTFMNIAWFSLRSGVGDVVGF